MGSHLGHKWRRFKRWLGGYFLLACVLGAVLAIVAMVMLMLTSVDWRPRP